MNGIEKITERITQDAQAELDRLTAETDAQADEILARYTAQAKADHDAIVARGAANAAERRDRLCSVAQSEARKLVLAAKQEVLDEAYQRAMEQLRSLPEQEAVALLALLACKASRTGQEQLVLSPTDHRRIGDRVVTDANRLLAERGGPASLTLAAAPRPIWGGVLLSEGDVEVDASFETLVRLVRDTSSREIAEILFG